MTLSKLHHSISRREWKMVFLTALALAAITLLPLLYGWWRTGTGMVFSGVHFASIVDWFVYYSYIQQIKDGHWLLADQFSTEKMTPVFNIFWLATGLLARILDLSPMIAFNLTRLALIPVFFYVAYLFLALIFTEIRQRKMALGLLAFSSGLGLLLIDRLWRFPGNFAHGQLNLPLDLWVPESNTFLTLYYSPHLIASLTLILAIFLLSLIFAQERRLVYGFGAGILSLILFSFHPFHILTVLTVIFVYFLVNCFQQKKIDWLWAKFGLLVFGLSLPATVYYLYLLKSDIFVRLKVAQNICLITPLWITVFSFGLPLFGAFAALILLYRKKITPARFGSHALIFTVTWFLVQAALLYSPVSWQRRMTEGFHFPLVVLSVIALDYGYQFFKEHGLSRFSFVWEQRYLIGGLLGILFFATNFFNLLLDGFLYHQKMEFTYLPAAYLAAGDFLKTEDPDQNILNSSRAIVNYWPALAPQRVYVGHGVETIDFFGKEREVAWFFKTDRSAAVEKRFLAKRNINLILYTQTERLLGDYNPATKPYLKQIYANESVQIYRVLQ